MPVGQFIVAPIEPDREFEQQAGDLVEPSSGMANWAARQLGISQNPLELLTRSRELREAKEGRRFTGGTGAGEFGDISYEELPSKKLTAEEANKKYGMPGAMEPFTEDISERAAQILRQRAEERTHLQSIIERTRGWGYAAVLANEFAVGAVDPINVASAFIPVTRAVPFLRGLPVMGEAGATIGARVAGRIGTGAIEGAAGAAMIEPIISYYSQEELQDYTMSQSLLNIVFGSVLGAGLNVGIPAIYRVGETVPDWLRGLKSQTVQNAQEIAARQLASGELPDVEAVIKSDPRVSSKSVADSVELTDTPEPKIVEAPPTQDVAELVQFAEAASATKPGGDFEVLASSLKGFVEAKDKFQAIARHPKVTLEFGFDGLVIGGKNLPQEVAEIELNGVKFEKVDHQYRTPKKLVGEVPWLKAKTPPPGVEVNVGMIIKEKDGRVWVMRDKKTGDYYFPGVGPWQGGTEAQSFARTITFAKTGLETEVKRYGSDLNQPGRWDVLYEGERVGGFPSPQVHEQLLLTSIDELYTSGKMNPTTQALLDRYLQIVSELDTSGIKNTEHLAVPTELKNGLKDSSIDGGETLGQFQNIRDISEFEIATEMGVAGSNKGFFAELKETGELYYIKNYDNELQSKVEYLSSLLYKLGQEAIPSSHLSYPHTELVMGDGKAMIASKVVPGSQGVHANNLSQLSSGAQSSLREDFAMDAWLANWDALQSNNVQLVGTADVVKIDYGGTMMFRAQGGAKNFGAEVPEIHTLTDPGKNPAANFYKGASKEETATGVSRVLSIDNNQLKSAISLAGFTGETADSLYSILLARQESIAQYWPDVTKSAMHGLKGVQKLIKAHDAIEYIKDLASKIWKKYTTEERQAISAYQHSETDVNNYLRSKNLAEAPGYIHDTVKYMDSAAKKFALEKETFLYRWVQKSNLTIDGQQISPQNFSKFIGRRGKDMGFMSTMLAKEGGFYGAKPVEIIFKAPAGTHGIPVNAAKAKAGVASTGYETEVEFLTDRGLSWTIESVVMKENGKFQVMAQIDHPMKTEAVTYDSIAQHLEKKKTQSSMAADTEPVPDVDKVAQEIDELTIPTLEVEVESKSIAKIKESIAEIEASMKAAGVFEEAESKAIFEDADAYAKETENYAKAIKQAWICYKGAA